MLLRWPIFAVLALAACEGPASNGSHDGAAAGYPPAPYGTQTGTVIENLELSAKNVDCDPSVQFYDQLVLAPITLDGFHERSDLTYLLVSTVAGWCDACNHEQSQMAALSAKYRPQGVRVLEVLIQGYNQISAAQATETDVNHWATVHSLTVGLALDPSGQMSRYVDLSVSPSMNMLVRLSDMEIVHRAAGEELLDPVIASFLQ